MKKLLLQIDSSPHPSVFDRVVAFDGGADEVLSYGGVTEDAVRDLVHGAIFTRGPKHLHSTAIFIGGTDMAQGERLLAAVRKAFFGPLRVSVMLDSNGCNTTAATGVAKIVKAMDVRGQRVVVGAGTGPVGLRAAGMLASEGVEAHLAGGHLLGGIGELPAFGLLGLLVEDEDAEHASGLIDEYNAAQTMAGEETDS